MKTAPHCSCQPFPLMRADEGTRLCIVAFMGGGNFNKRMIEVGLHVGAELTVHQFTGGGMVLRRGETRIALGGGMANKILVIPVNEKLE